MVEKVEQVEKEGDEGLDQLIRAASQVGAGNVVANT